MEFQEMNNFVFGPAESSPLSKRRRFVPNSTPFIASELNNSSLEDHTFNSPLILQLCEQAPTPEEIEASLLQVGMRIRKSVSEGYKNSPQKKFTPRPFFNVEKLSPETQQALLSGNIAGSSELSPYYAGGMHDVGAMAMQPVSTATFCGINLSVLSHFSDNLTEPSISEQSLWSYSNSHKRSYEADSDSDDSQEWLPRTPVLAAEAGMAMPVDYFNIGMEEACDVSPFTQMEDQARSTSNGRRLAKPKSRMRLQQRSPDSTFAYNPFANLTMPEEASPFENEPDLANEVPSENQGMMNCSVGFDHVNDFGDAPFLVQRDEVEMDCS